MLCLAFTIAGVRIAAAQQTQPVVTLVTDFENDAVASSITEVRNVLATDCAARRASIPARGRSALAIEIGATVPGASVACDLLLRVPMRFAQADRVASYCWIRGGEIRLGFRIRDAQNHIFETPLQTVRTPNRWVHVAAELKASTLRALDADAELTWPIRILGYRVETDEIGRQTVLLDDLQLEHRVEASDTISGTFSFDNPTKIYEPGATVGAKVSIENKSHRKRLTISIELAWVREDGTKIKTQHRTAINLLPSGNDYRSRQPIDFSLRINEPGLYRLVARVRSRGWRAARVFETTIAVMRSNRNLSRGRSAFIGLRTNLFREPITDQMLEIELARDIGVHLLAVDVPWGMIEPKPEQMSYRELDRVVNAVTSRDMAILIALTQPPPWLDEENQDFGARQAALIESLATRYGGRARRFQLPADARNTVEAMRRARHKAASVHPDVTVIAPSMALPLSPGSSLASAARDDDMPQAMFETQGDPIAAGGVLREFSNSAAVSWRSSDWWRHTAGPEPGDGTVSDAEAIVRHYAEAVSRGVAGLIWFDLRDDGNDPESPELMRGLVSRDFSPKHALLGFAAAARVFTGMRYAGQVSGAPPEYDSAYFIGSERHLAMMLPKPNRRMPAVLAPFQTAPGSLEMFDFHGGNIDLLTSRAPPLVLTSRRPFFVALNLQNAEPEPQLGFGRSWLNVPSQVFFEDQADLAIEIIAPTRLAGSFLQIEPPPNAPFTSNVKAKLLRARAGDKIRHDIVLSSRGDAQFQRSRCDVKLTIEGDEISVPVEVVRQAVVSRIAPDADPAAPDLRIATLSGPARGATAFVELYASYNSRELTLTLDVTDDRHLPFDPEQAESDGGDELLVGLALEGADAHAEFRLAAAGADALATPLFGTSTQQLRDWRFSASDLNAAGRRRFVVTVTAKSLGLRSLGVGRRFLACVRYLDDDGAGQRNSHNWGEGLDGSRSTDRFLWLRLGSRRR